MLGNEKMLSVAKNIISTIMLSAMSPLSIRRSAQLPDCEFFTLRRHASDIVLVGCKSSADVQNSIASTVSVE